MPESAFVQSFRDNPRISTFSPTIRSTSLMGTRSCFMLSHLLSGRFVDGDGVP